MAFETAGMFGQESRRPEPPISTQAGELTVGYQLQVLEKMLSVLHSAVEDLSQKLSSVCEPQLMVATKSARDSDPPVRCVETVERLRAYNEQLNSALARMSAISTGLRL